MPATVRRFSIADRPRNGSYRSFRPLEQADPARLLARRASAAWAERARPFLGGHFAADRGAALLLAC